MPKADATELAPKKSAVETLRHIPLLPEGFCSCPHCSDNFQSAHFFGEAPERRPWVEKREARQAAFAGRSKCILRDAHNSRDSAGAYTGKYPIPRLAICRQLQPAAPTGI